MATEILVFESDAAFAQELEKEFSKLGAVTRLVDDGAAGIEAALQKRPDLILLAIELPRMNGFSICNKIKKDPALKDIPLIIMSSDSSEETFEQHRKLRTRADDYLRKPIAFGELLERVQKFVSIGANGEKSDVADSIAIEEEIELDDELVLEAGESAPAPAAALEIDDEVDAFAESAFDRILDHSTSAPPPASGIAHSAAAPAISTPPSVPPPLSHRPSAPPPPPRLGSVPPRPPTDSLELERLRAELERVKSERGRLEQELTTLRAEKTRLEDQVEQEARKSAEVQRLQRELDELKAKASSGARPAGVSSREYLDLREALNKKDKELLGLRDQISRREKELLDLRDVNLALERERADQDDKIFALERELGESRNLIEALRADKEQAAKRADDFKARAEKTKAELDAKLAELAATKQRHSEELAALTEEHRKALEQARAECEAAVQRAEEEGRRQLEAAVAKAREEEAQAREQALAAAAERAREALEKAVADREAELVAEHEDRLASLYRANEEARAELVAEHTAVRNELEGKVRELQTLLDEARAAHAALEQAKQEAEATRDARIAALSADLARESENRHELALELTQARNRITELEGGWAITRADLADAREKLTQQTERADRAYAKWESDRNSLARVKEALAAALANIEEIESRKLET